MGVLVDDVGSFPLPAWIDREQFNGAYVQAREAICTGKSIKKDELLLKNFYQVVIDSFRKKCATGLDVVNYPQHYDMHRQITDLIYKAMDNGTYLIDEKCAVIPEVHVIDGEAKTLYEEFGKRIPLRVCITGPMELYLKVMGTIPHKDVLMTFAESVRRFARNSILDSKHARTEVISLDEPSFGFQDISADKDVILDVLEKAFDFAGVTKQIHLHSSSRLSDILGVRNLDVLSFEFGASPKNVEGCSKKMVEEADKRLRVGIARTDVDAIAAELRDRGFAKPETEQMAEHEEVIRKRFLIAKKKYGDSMAFTGPDCGLGGWPTQESAQLLLKRTVDAVRHA